MATLASPEPGALRKWRTRHGLTQAKAAEIVGVHERSWRRWENGERRVPRMLALWMIDQNPGGNHE